MDIGRLTPIKVGAFLLFCIGWSITAIAPLPVTPITVPDSWSYLAFADHRPHGYPAVLAVYGRIFGSLDYLPALQGASFLGSIIFLSLALSVRLDNILPGISTFAIATQAPGFNLGGGFDFSVIMSDTMFSSALIIAVGFFLLLQSKHHLLFLALASLSFGAAATFRTSGYVPLLLFFVYAAWFSLRAGKVRRVAGLAATLGPAVALLVAAALSNLAHNGRLAIGSWGGMSILGKGLLVAEPLPTGHPYSHLNWVQTERPQAWQSFERLESPYLRMLAARQYYEYLRWFHFWQSANERWPEWRTSSKYEQGVLAGKLASVHLRNHPERFAKLVGFDFVSLWLLPRILTEREAQYWRGLYEARSKGTLLRQIQGAEAAQNDYFQVVPNARGLPYVVGVRLVSLGFLGITLLMALGFIFSAKVRGLAVAHADLVFVAVVVHASYVTTAVVEAGLERYVGSTWPLVAAGFSSAVYVACRLMFKRGMSKNEVVADTQSPRPKSAGLKFPAVISEPGFISRHSP